MKQYLPFILSLFACAFLFIPLALAQSSDETSLEVYTWDGSYDVDGETSYLAGPMYNVSGNGEWAVGYDDFCAGASYVWNRTTGDLEIVLDAYIYDVADDGTMVGTFVDDEGYCHAGYCKDGEWTELPLPESASATTSITYAPSATMISDDGTVISGSYGAAIMKPLQWIDGELKEFSDIPSRNVGTLFVDQSQDGSILVGLTASTVGDHLPCYYKDSLVLVYENPEGVDAEAADSDLRTYWIEGRVQHIGTDGIAYGFYSDENGESVIFSVDTSTGIVAEADAVLMGEAEEGLYYTSEMQVYDGTTFTDVSDYLNISFEGSGISAVSNDGMVIVGAGYHTTSFGSTPFPFVIDRAAPPYTSGIECVEAEAQTSLKVGSNGQINFSDGVVAVKVFDVQGREVETCIGSSVNLSAQPKGTYLLRATDAKGQVSTFKVIR